MLHQEVKTIQLADERDDDATLIATELHPHRVTLLEEGLTRAGIKDVEVLERDASDPNNLTEAPFDVPFDLIPTRRTLLWPWYNSASP